MPEDALLTLNVEFCGVGRMQWSEAGAGLNLRKVESR